MPYSKFLTLVVLTNLFSAKVGCRFGQSLGAFQQVFDLVSLSIIHVSKANYRFERLAIYPAFCKNYFRKVNQPHLEACKEQKKESSCFGLHQTILFPLRLTQVSLIFVLEGAWFTQISLLFVLEGAWFSQVSHRFVSEGDFFVVLSPL